MIIPSVDIQNGQAVQLIEGKTLAIEAGDPYPIAKKFSRVGEIAVIDLDAAMGVGENGQIIKTLVREFPCRVGGGIRSYEKAKFWLDAGAEKIIIGTAAEVELLKRLPKERVIVALDHYFNNVVINGWTERSGVYLGERLTELSPYVGGFLITLVHQEGKMTGLSNDDFLKYIGLQEKYKTYFTLAGGIKDLIDINNLDMAGIDTQVGMALYTGELKLGEVVASTFMSLEELTPTIVTDTNGVVLGFCYSNTESLIHSIETGKATYWSRKRGLWVKGETSGNTQEVIRIIPDCDKDSIKVIVKQTGKGFCHKNTYTCWGEGKNGLVKLEQTIQERKNSAGDSYTQQLLANSDFLRSKLLEEAEELADASSKEDVIWEAADLIYFTLVRMGEAGVTLADVERELDLRARRKNSMWTFYDLDKPPTPS